MTLSLDERLNQILPRLTSRDFLDSKGLGNEIGFWIFDYPPEREMEVRSFVSGTVLPALAKQVPPLKIARVDLFKLVTELLQERKLLDKAIAMQSSKGNDSTLAALRSVLKEDKLAQKIASQFDIPGLDLMILTGVGSVYPMLRTHTFLRAVWGLDTLVENMAWLAESLGTKATETPEETIRRYIADKFFKDHLQTYKKRPIYWLFSSGKQGAFQALVYLHRYNESTLARLRAEYVMPLTGKIQSRIDMLQKDAEAASSTAARNKLSKEVEKLKKKHVELLAYDEQLRHHADMRITLDLDDGVKVNYGKFGNLLDSVKVVTGGANED